jgi:hypothetical protein
VFMLYRHIFLMGVRTCKLVEDFWYSPLPYVN